MYDVAFSGDKQHTKDTRFESLCTRDDATTGTDHRPEKRWWTVDCVQSPHHFSFAFVASARPYFQDISNEEIEEQSVEVSARSKEAVDQLVDHRFASPLLTFICFQHLILVCFRRILIEAW